MSHGDQLRVARAAICAEGELGFAVVWTTPGPGAVVHDV